MRGLEEHIDLMLDSLDVDDFALVGSHADHLMAEQGWDFAPSGEEYRYLCRRILRARLAAFRDELRRLQGDFSPPTTTDPDFGPRRAKVPDDARTLRELIDAFVKHREGTWAPSTKKNYAIITRVLEEICGEETPLNEIDGDFCLRVLDTVKRLPSNYQKKALTRGKPIREVIDIAAAENMPIVQPATIKMHLDKLGAFIRFGRDKGWIVGNPMALVEVYDPVHPSEKRDPFTIEQLNKIFAMEPWASRNQRPGGRPSRYWGPLIALFSGARLGEICGTRLDEIIQHNGISLIDIRHRADRTVKTGQSRRVPVHAALIELGFLDFVGEQRDIGETMLFPEEKRNSNGLWGDALTDWFSRAIKDLNLVGRKLTMHAFRHTFEDALREADLHDTAIASALTGRWSPGQNKNYGTRGHSTQKLSAAMSKIAFPGLVLAGLTPVSADARGPTLTTDELHD